MVNSWNPQPDETPTAQPAPAQQPQAAPPTPKKAVDPQKMQQVNALLGQIGLDVETVAALVAPFLPQASISKEMLTDAVQEAIVRLHIPEQLQGAVRQMVDQEGAKMQAVVSQQGQGAPMMPGGNEMVPLLMRMFMPDPAVAPMGGLGAFAQITEMIKAMSVMKQSIVEEYRAPFLDGARATLDNLSTTYRTGGDPERLVLDGYATTVRPALPAAPVAAHSQPLTTAEIVRRARKGANLPDVHP